MLQTQSGRNLSDKQIEQFNKYKVNVAAEYTKARDSFQSAPNFQDRLTQLASDYMERNGIPFSEVFSDDPHSVSTRVRNQIDRTIGIIENSTTYQELPDDQKSQYLLDAINTSIEIQNALTVCPEPSDIEIISRSSEPTIGKVIEDNSFGNSRADTAIRIDIDELSDDDTNWDVKARDGSYVDVVKINKETQKKIAEQKEQMAKAAQDVIDSLDKPYPKDEPKVSRFKQFLNSIFG